MELIEQERREELLDLLTVTRVAQADAKYVKALVEHLQKGR